MTTPTFYNALETMNLVTLHHHYLLAQANNIEQMPPMEKKGRRQKQILQHDVNHMLLAAQYELDYTAGTFLLRLFFIGVAFAAFDVVVAVAAVSVVVAETSIFIVGHSGMVRIFS